MHKKAVIIGAGPAGLTAGYELAYRSDIQPVILEKSNDIGGLSKTVNYKGNRIDIGGHRFFSKSDRVMAWWLQLLPLQSLPDKDITLQYQQQTRVLPADSFITTGSNDKVMLVRNRLSRIFYLKKFFNYPLSLSIDTIQKLGWRKFFKIGISYLRARLQPHTPEVTLEDFFINRFGKELYYTFFKDYTEKVWGLACVQIPAEWGNQRIKELSIGKALLHALKEKYPFARDTSLNQKKEQTSLIERFLYPKYGPGQLWETVAEHILDKGGHIHRNSIVVKIYHHQYCITHITTLNTHTGEQEMHKGDYFFSSMPVKDLINAFEPAVPTAIAAIANGLQYRDFITVGLLLRKLKIADGPNLIKDNWIYIQDHSVKLGRLQIYNNWSPYMVASADTVWLGLEYFCQQGDQLWEMPDNELIAFAINELEQIGFIDAGNVLDNTLLRVEKTYPAYSGTYDRFNEVKNYVNQFGNLFLTGRNGMHKYNNSDHSMLTAMTAVDNILQGLTAKENIWQVNTEQEYHETSKTNK